MASPSRPVVSAFGVRPEDAKWLFRWTLPEVPYAPGYITVEWPGGTKVIIED